MTREYVRKETNSRGEEGPFCGECCNFENCDRPHEKFQPEETIACDNFDKEGMNKVY